MEGTEENADHDGKGDARHDVAALNIDHGRGTSGDTDHEIRRGGTHFERHFHAVVHGQHFQHARSDTEDARKHTGQEHYAEAARHVGELVRHGLSVFVGIVP